MVWHCKTIRMADNIHMHGGEGEATSFPVLITLPWHHMQQPEEKSAWRIHSTFSIDHVGSMIFSMILRGF